jgi:hypothetical protein
MEIGETARAIPELHEALANLEKGDTRRPDCHVNLALANKFIGNISGSIYHWKQVHLSMPVSSL